MSYDDIDLIRDERVRLHARAVAASTPLPTRPLPPRPVAQVRQVDADGRPVRTLPEVSGGAGVEPGNPIVADRSFVLTLQGGGSIAKQTFADGSVIWTVLEAEGYEAQVLANPEEDALLSRWIGGVR